MFDRFASQFQTVARRCRSKPMLPASILLILVGFGVFAEIAEDVGERESHGFDRSILIAMRDSINPPNPWGSEAAVQIIRDITSLGGFTVLTGLTLASIGAAFFLGKPRLAALIAVAISGGMVLSALMKRGFDRPRPDLVPHGVIVTSASFPSGHAMMSAIVYLTLGVLLARTQPLLAFRVYLLFLSVCITILVGLSRIYLGVHWPTDVFAGWAFGIAWSLLFGLIAIKIDPHSQIK